MKEKFENINQEINDFTHNIDGKLKNLAKLTDKSILEKNDYFKGSYELAFKFEDPLFNNKINNKIQSYFEAKF
jgi:hypothetical protein